jgi:hypothetical protein
VFHALEFEEKEFIFMLIMVWILRKRERENAMKNFVYFLAHWQIW